MRVGVLTGGGDCPGLNAVIRAVVRKGIGEYGDEVVGFRDGWRGVLEGDTVPMDLRAVRGILPRGGTIRGSTRTNPVKIQGGVEQIKAKHQAPRVCDQPDRWAVDARHFRENCLDPEGGRPAYGGRWQAPEDCSRLDGPWNDPTLSREMGPA